MYFAQRSKSYGDLYVPAFTVSLGSESRDMLTSHGLAATSVSVDLGLSMSGKFSFSIPDTFDAERSEFLTRHKDRALDLLTPGKRVWIRMGYGDRKSQKLLLSGYITTVGTSFTEGGSPTLEVSGYDSTYLLTLGSQKRQFLLTVEDMVARIARENGLTAKVVGTPGNKMMLGPNMQTDLAYLDILSKKYCGTTEKFEFYARATSSGDELHFRPRQMASAPVGTLTWGVDLLSFNPEFTLGQQVSKVRVLGWDEVTKKVIVGEATREPAPSGDGTTGGAMQKKSFGKEAVLQIRHPVRTKQEADDRAASELAQRAQSFVEGHGDTFGLPELLPDTNVALAGLGKLFSKTFYVSKTVHRCDASGYRTTFTIERTAI
jgi:Bacteriophage probable baseplate hub protein